VIQKSWVKYTTKQACVACCFYAEHSIHPAVSCCFLLQNFAACLITQFLNSYSCTILCLLIYLAGKRTASLCHLVPPLARQRTRSNKHPRLCEELSVVSPLLSMPEKKKKTHAAFFAYTLNRNHFMKLKHLKLTLAWLFCAVHATCKNHPAAVHCPLH